MSGKSEGSEKFFEKPDFGKIRELFYFTKNELRHKSNEQKIEILLYIYQLHEKGVALDVGKLIDKIKDEFGSKKVFLEGFNKVLDKVGETFVEIFDNILSLFITDQFNKNYSGHDTTHLSRVPYNAFHLFFVKEQYRKDVEEDVDELDFVKVVLILAAACHDLGRGLEQIYNQIIINFKKKGEGDGDYYSINRYLLSIGKPFVEFRERKDGEMDEDYREAYQFFHKNRMDEILKSIEISHGALSGVVVEAIKAYHKKIVDYDNLEKDEQKALDCFWDIVSTTCALHGKKNPKIDSDIEKEDILGIITLLKMLKGLDKLELVSPVTVFLRSFSVSIETGNPFWSTSAEEGDIESSSFGKMIVLAIETVPPEDPVLLEMFNKKRVQTLVFAKLFLDCLVKENNEIAKKMQEMFFYQIEETCATENRHNGHPLSLELVERIKEELAKIKKLDLSVEILKGRIMDIKDTTDKLLNELCIIGYYGEQWKYRLFLGYKLKEALTKTTKSGTASFGREEWDALFPAFQYLLYAAESDEILDSKKWVSDLIKKLYDRFCRFNRTLLTHDYLAREEKQFKLDL